MKAGDILSLLLSLLGMVLVLYACYKFSRYMAKKVNTFSGSDNIKIIERTALGQDKGLAVVLICGKYYLIGYANNDIEILKELENYTPPQKDEADKSNSNFFLKFLNDNKKFYSGLKSSFLSPKQKESGNDFSSVFNSELRKNKTNEAENNDQQK